MPLYAFPLRYAVHVSSWQLWDRWYINNSCAMFVLNSSLKLYLGRSYAEKGVEEVADIARGCTQPVRLHPDCLTLPPEGSLISECH